MIGCIGRIDHTEAVALCPSVAISSSPPLTTIAPNPQRERLNLNGIWQFIPVTGKRTEQAPAQDWGTIRVPGDWQQEGNDSVPGVIDRGKGEAWANFAGRSLEKAWYRQKLSIPANWQGRAIALNVKRLSTDAKVYVNGKSCGDISWPDGAIDISSLAEPGKENTLDLFVAAIADEKDKLVVMSPNEIRTEKADKSMDSRGLIGEVELLSFPNNGRINDVFVQPSVRQKQLKIAVELEKIARAGTVNFTAQIFNEQGQIEKEFSSSAPVKAEEVQTVNLSWNWENPRLWDVGQPNLYTVRLQAKGEGIADEYDQSFGFREFWIEGKKFFLNGTEIRLRPTLHEDIWRGWAVGLPQVAEAAIAGYVKTGYNIAELWPWNYRERGRWHFREIFLDRADAKGFPVIAPALDAIPYADDWKNKQASWEPEMAAELRRDRNHPAILMWANSPNYFGHSDDQNPRRIGIKDFAGGLSENENSRVAQIKPVGEDAIATIKKYDPTRPAFLHQGAFIGDVYALNSYLNFTPLQEREEWLSNWQQKGQMPYTIVELGTPLHTSAMRGRNGFGGAIVSEPLMTEFSAIYLGKEAYNLETPAYRQKIRDFFVKDQEYKNWHNQGELDFAPAFQKIQNLFSTNTWRSWRTWGITGGMIPWNEGHGWEITSTGREKIAPPPTPLESRGPHLRKVDRYLLNPLQPPAQKIHPGGEAIIANDGSILAWIAGSTKAFVEKDHNYNSGDPLEKQAVLLNDTRQTQSFSLNWQVNIGGRSIATGKEAGNIEAAKTLFFPINATLPKVSAKSNGEIILTAKIGNFPERSDRFPFRVFANPPAADRTLTVFDPVGKTSKMLQQLGYTVKAWNGGTADAPIIIGREALSQASAAATLQNLKSQVASGAKAVIFLQKREWLQDKLGLRVAHPLSRRAFPVNADHPAIQGLDAEDWRDWRGESTLIEAYPDTTKNPVKASPQGLPWYGWHWGNRGAVSSAAIEKPHYSGWRSILEAEFDLAYSPLMELNYGKGRLIFCMLDVEDRLQDGAARQFVGQLLDYAATAPEFSRAQNVVLIGSENDAKFLNNFGVVYQSATTLKDANLAIIGAEATVSDADLQAYLERGGKAYFLPRKTAIAGISFKEVEQFNGSLNVPQWQELAGISASDLRARSSYKTTLIASGGEVGADGLLSRIQNGKGVAIFSQLNPDGLNADAQTYLRYTRWRHSRAIAQILANLGATFNTDAKIFDAIAGTPSTQPFYHSDYRTDFELGDDPYRYYRW
ncbi:beta-galactosidase [Oscillatoria sp. FACHB-1406]|uniref:beta-galactosidase n=1 Tax=Oscillatoria sp. FACHB-1406 TaxID=2692846 RepID=UPI001F54EA4D|nr:beta-galactosidase [Oscillatoria sp. FACHB-1406]